MKKVSRLQRDVGGVAGPDRHRQQHDVHGRESRDCETPHQILSLTRVLGLRRARHKWMCRIAHVLERSDDLLRHPLARSPRGREPPVGEIDARIEHPGKTLDRCLDAPNATPAGDTLDRDLHLERAIRAAAREQRKVCGVRHRLDPRHDQRNTIRLLERNSSSPPRTTSSRRSHCPGGTSAIPSSLPGARSCNAIGRSRRASAGCASRASTTTPETGTPPASRRLTARAAVPSAVRVSSATTFQSRASCASAAACARLKARAAWSAFTVSTPPKVKVAGRLMTGFTAASVAKNSTRLTNTIRPVSLNSDGRVTKDMSGPLLLTARRSGRTRAPPRRYCGRQP